MLHLGVGHLEHSLILHRRQGLRVHQRTNLKEKGDRQLDLLAEGAFFENIDLPIVKGHVQAIGRPRKDKRQQTIQIRIEGRLHLLNLAG